MTPEFLEAILHKEQNNSKIFRVLSINSEPAVSAGDNYLSTVKRVYAEVILGSGLRRKISVIVKDANEGGPTADMMNKLDIFGTEIMVYTKIIRGMEELMYEFDDRRGPLWCKLIWHEQSRIIFEDLKQLNFRGVNRSDCLDVAHSKLAIRGLARLHAMSRVLIKRNYFTSNDLRRYPIIGDITFAENVFGNGLRVLSKEVKTWGPQWKDIAERIANYSYIVANKLLELSEIDENAFNVMNHGDSWECNMMFKYDPYENKPIEFRLIDFQFCHYQSYGWDLTYFMYVSLLGDFRRKHYKELIEEYTKTLRDTLLFYKYSEESEIPTVGDVIKEMRRVRHLRIPFCLLTHPVLTGPVRKPYDLEIGLTNESNDGNFGYNLDVFRIRYKDEIGPDIIRFAELGII